MINFKYTSRRQYTIIDHLDKIYPLLLYPNDQVHQKGSCLKDFLRIMISKTHSSNGDYIDHDSITTHGVSFL